MSKDDDGDEGWLRIDFTIVGSRPTEDPTIIELELVPNPDRYETIEFQGKPHYKDKFFGYVISREDINRAAAKTLGSIVQSQPGENFDIDEHINYRNEISKINDIDINDKKALNLKKHSPIFGGQSMEFAAFVSVDIVGSTIRQNADFANFNTIYQRFIEECSIVVARHHGNILKTTGDGFIAYSCLKSRNNTCDAVADIGLSILHVVDRIVNKFAADRGLDPISVRVGADCGSAHVLPNEVAEIKFAQPDVASQALNMAVKIEQGASPGEFRLGRNMFEHLHVDWLMRCVPVQPLRLGGDSPPYSVYVLS